MSSTCRSPSCPTSVTDSRNRASRPVQHQLADLVAEERAGLLRPTAARSAAPGPAGPGRAVNCCAQRLQPIRKPTRIGCGAWLCSGETVSWCTRVVQPAGAHQLGGVGVVDVAGEHQRRRRRGPVLAAGHRRSARGPAARRSRRTRPSARGRPPGAASRPAGPARRPSCRTLSVSFQRSRLWMACGSSQGSDVPDDQVVDALVDRAAASPPRPSRTRRRRASGGPDSSSTRPARLSIMISRASPQCRTKLHRMLAGLGVGRARPSRGAAARRLGSVVVAEPVHRLPRRVVGQLLRAEVAQVLVDPVADQAAADPVRPPRLAR